MKSKKKEKLSLKEATMRLSALMGEQLNSIPPKERKKKTESVYKKLLARIHGKKVSTSDDEPSKSVGPGPTGPARLVARSRS